MAVSPFKIFVAGEVLTASDLNSSFAQVFDNGESLGWPRTQATDFDGNELILDADQDTTITADTDDQIDFRIGGNDRMRMLISSTVPDFRVLWNDADTAAGPYLSTFRDSATPAADDILGRIRWLGRDSGGSDVVTYAALDGQIATATDGSEDGRILVMGMVSGTIQRLARFGAGYTFQLNSESAGTGPSPRFILNNDSSTPADDDVIGQIEFDGNDSDIADETYASIKTVIRDVTASDTDAELVFSTIHSGTLRETFKVGSQSDTSIPVARLYANSDDAVVGPILYLQRDSASPADDDVLAGVYFRGDDEDGPTEQTYAKVEAFISDATNASLAGGLQISTVTGGSLARALDIGPGGVAVGEPTGGVPATAGHLNAVALFDDNSRVYSLAAGLESAIATTSGTAINFTDIRADAHRITVTLSGVSTDGTEEFLLRIGPSGGLATSGYVSLTNQLDSSAGSGGDEIGNAASTAGFIILGIAADAALTGQIMLTHAGSNTWICSYSLMDVTNSDMVIGAGSVTLGGTISLLTLTSTNTPDDFDAGSMNILVE